MHVYPLIVVDGCGDGKEAMERAGGWADELIEEWETYDYGGPLTPGKDGELAGIVIQAGAREYREAISWALGVEKDLIKEHWDVLRQALAVFGDRDTPPSLEEAFDAHYRMGAGCGGFIKSGTEMLHKESFGLALYRAKKLAQLLEGRPSLDRFLYDKREQTPCPAGEEKRSQVWAVRCDFHY